MWLLVVCRRGKKNHKVNLTSIKSEQFHPPTPPLTSQNTQFTKLYIFHYDSVLWKFLGWVLEFVKAVSWNGGVEWQGGWPVACRWLMVPFFVVLKTGQKSKCCNKKHFLAPYKNTIFLKYLPDSLLVTPPIFLSDQTNITKRLPLLWIVSKCV